jgi:hypothetical protein
MLRDMRRIDETQAELVTAASSALLEQLRVARTRAWLASPYISLTAARRVIEHSAAIPQEGRRLLTAAADASVRAGVLSAQALLELREAGFRLASDDRLHAKLYLVDAWGLVGSGNLTGAGLGLERKGNLELGVELGTAQLRGAEAIFRRWWAAAEPLSDARLEHLASLPVTPPPRAPAPTDSTLSGAEDLEAILAEGAGGVPRRYWIKANYHRHDEEDWWQRGWISDHKRASYARRDLAFLYISAHEGGPARCPAVARVLNPVRHDPEFVRAEGDVEAVEQWPYVTDVAPVAQILPVGEGVELETMGKSPQSLQGGYCELTREQFEDGARDLLQRLT